MSGGEDPRLALAQAIGSCSPTGHVYVGGNDACLAVADVVTAHLAARLEGCREEAVAASRRGAMAQWSEAAPPWRDYHGAIPSDLPSPQVDAVLAVVREALGLEPASDALGGTSDGRTGRDGTSNAGREGGGGAVTTWRNSRCAVGYCQAQASLNIHVLPLCHAHGMEIAQDMSGAIIAKHQLEQEAELAARNESRESRAGNREGGSIYYARIGDYIKIGYSARLRNRIRTLRVDELLAVEPGDPALERSRHRQFADERIDLRRENFRPSDRLTAHVSDLNRQHGLPRWARLPRTSVIRRSAL